MSTETAFLGKISQVKQQTFLRTLVRLLLVTAFLFLCGYTVVVALEVIGKIYVQDYMLIYAGLFGVAFAGALGYVLLTRERFMDVLIDLDTRLHLHDRISTAYEYHTQKKPSNFVELLIDDAGQQLSLLSNKQLFPLKLSLIHLLIALLLAINLALLGFGHLFSGTEPEPVDPNVREKVRTAIQNYLAKQPRKEGEAKKNPAQQQRIQRRFDQMTKKLEEQAMSRKELLDSLQKTLKEVQSEQKRLTQDLDSELKTIENVEELPVRDLPKLKRLSSSEIQKLERMFGEMLEGGLPEDIQQNLEMLQQYSELEEMIDNLIDEAESGAGESDQTASETSRGSEDGTSSGGEEGEGDSQQQETENARGGRPHDMLSPDMERADTGGIPGQGLPGMDGEGLDEEDSSAQPGTGRSSGEQYDPYPIERGDGSFAQDRMAPARRDEYNAHIRSLTTIGEATIPEQEVTRVYQQELESILQKEDIPLNYREYIKSYFIGIGLTKGEDTYGRGSE